MLPKASALRAVSLRSASAAARGSGLSPAGTRTALCGTVTATARQHRAAYGGLLSVSGARAPSAAIGLGRYRSSVPAPLPVAHSSSAPNPCSGCAPAVSTLLSAGVGGCHAASCGIVPHAVLPRHAGCATGLSTSVSSSIGAWARGITHALPQLHWDAAPLPILHTYSLALAPASCWGVGGERIIHPGPMYFV